MSNENNLVRIVNLEDDFTEETLKRFIVMNCQPSGDVKKIYLKRDDKLDTFYGYVIFEYDYDASKAVGILNEHIFNTNKLEVELIGPNLKHRKYGYNVQDILAETRRRGLGQVQVDEVDNEKDMTAPNILPALNRFPRFNRGIVRRVPDQVQINRANNERAVTARNIHPPVNRGTAVRVQTQVQINRANNERVSGVQSFLLHIGIGQNVFQSVHTGNNQNVLAAGPSRSASGPRYILPHLRKKPINGASNIS